MHQSVKLTMARPVRSRARLLALIAVGGTLILAHLYLQALPLSAVSPLALLDRMFDVVLAASVALLSLGVGVKPARSFTGAGCSALELGVTAFALGTGALSLALLFLGFLHLLYPALLILLLAGGIALTAREWSALLASARSEWAQRAPFSPADKLMVAALVALGLPVLLRALMPPTDVDGLGYHLVAPALFLDQHAVIVSTSNIGVNYPIGVDFLYMFALAARSDISSQLIHFTFALALTGGIAALAARLWDRRTALLAAVVFWASPIVGLEASAPLIDLGWAFYEFIAVTAFLRWQDSRSNWDLALSGVGMGLAVSNKVLAGVGIVLLGTLVVVESFRTRPRRFGPMIRNACLFGIATALVALPWYLKDWVWLGNPVYPFFLGSYGLDGVLQKPTGALGGLESWVGLGMGHDLAALFLFPINVYAHWDAFGMAHNRGGPTLLFLFLPLYVLMPKHRVLNWLWLIIAARFAFWWSYAQNIRYLFFAFPWLSLISAYTIRELSARLFRPASRAAVATVVGLFCLFGIGLQWGFLFLLHADAVPFLIGQVSREDYLTENSRDFASVRFINEKLPEDAKILGIGNARVFYAHRFILLDDSRANWRYLVERGQDARGIADLLKQWGITHIWVSRDDLAYVLNYWDRGGRVKDSLQVLADLETNYMRPLYEDERGYAIYALGDSSQP